jgi:hypothetical protein
VVQLLAIQHLLDSGQLFEQDAPSRNPAFIRQRGIARTRDRDLDGLTITGRGEPSEKVRSERVSHGIPILPLRDDQPNCLRHLAIRGFE